MTAHTCPTCGQRQPTVLGQLTLDPNGDVRWKGERIKLTLGERRTLSVIIAAKGNIISDEQVLAAIGSAGDYGTLKVYVHFIRQKTRSDLILRSYGHGYYFNADAALPVELRKAA